MSQAQFTRAALPELTPQERAVNRVAEATHRLNEAVRRATEEGYSIVLIRVSRIHDGNGNWGDQVVPSVREKRASAEAAS